MGFRYKFRKADLTPVFSKQYFMFSEWSIILPSSFLSVYAK